MASLISNACISNSTIHGRLPLIKNGKFNLHKFRINEKSERRIVLKSLKVFSSAEDTETIDVVGKVRNKKILVLGGNGFVGSAVSKEAISQGLEVVSLNRSGAPKISESWVKEVTWIKGDVFDTDWESHLSDIDSVISCIGGFGTNDLMEKINGDATILAVNEAFKSGVKKFVFISVHDYNLPSFALNNGYFNGKRRAESQVLSKFPTSGVILRPGFIYGKRLVNESVEVPLDLVGKPLESVLKTLDSAIKPLKSLPASDLLLAPPVDVQDVAKAAIAAVVVPEIVGIKTIEEIKEIAKQ